ncbi:MAG: ATP-binding protein [Nitrosospira sp.]|nr:ATP-binding protein [Nitrosospira sp.]
MIGHFLIHEFTPLWLNIDRIGPFQSRLESIDFTDANDESCNLYLFLSKNGHGKTTALELMAALMGMLSHDDAKAMAQANGYGSRTPFGYEALDRGPGRAQWDIRVRYSLDGDERVAVLSLIAGQIGTEVSLRFWDDGTLLTVGACEWHRFGFCRNEANSWAIIGRQDEWFEGLNDRLADAFNESVGGFEDSTLVWPTVIYFSAYRNVVPIQSSEERAVVAPRDWNYRPVHAFRTEGGHWRDSLDNLLVWLKWLDDGRYERALELVNKRVFDDPAKFVKGVRKEPPEAIVVNSDNLHRFDALSSGEKSLVQLFLRLGAHMTRNTILLIDEPEAHLHENWKYRLLYQFKKFAQDHFPGQTIIVATHSQEMMTALALELQEENLRKGGHLFETEEEEAKVFQIQEDAKKHYVKSEEE